MIQLQATMVSAVLAMQRISAAGSTVLQSLQPIRTRWQVFCGQFQHNLTHPPDPESIRNHHVAGVAVIGLAVISVSPCASRSTAMQRRMSDKSAS